MNLGDREYWDSVGHKPECFVWGDENLISRCTCGPQNLPPHIDPVRVATQAVADAWNNPGPRPDYHREAQRRLRKSWPTLAAAVEALAAEYH